MSSPLQAGDPAPDFTATVVGGEYGEGRTVSLQDFQGRTLVLYFYPKDDTPGCTTQACSLRDSWAQLEDLAVVFGVSPDSAAIHAKFIKKHALPFPLLADDQRRIVEAYGVWVEKSIYGRKYMGTERSTFIIDGQGKLQAVLRKVKPGEHVALVQAALKRSGNS